MLNATASPEDDSFGFLKRSTIPYLAAALVILGVAVPGMTATVIAEQACEPWEWAHPVPHGFNLTAVEWVPWLHTFVAVGDGVLTSEDGSSWLQGRAFGPDQAIDLAVSDDRLVVVGSRGFTAWSSDGVTWSRATVGDAFTLWNAVAHGEGRWVAVGSTGLGAGGATGAVVTSDDGTVWQLQPVTIPERIRDVVWDGSQFIAVADDSKVLRSPDGTSWTPASLPPVDAGVLDAIAWNGVRYVLNSRSTSRFWESPDADQWTLVPAGPFGSKVNSLKAVGTGFLAWGGLENSGGGPSAFSLSSPDGLSWSYSSAPDHLWDGASNGEDLVGVGTNGSTLLGEVEGDLVWETLTIQGLDSARITDLAAGFVDQGPGEPPLERLVANGITPGPSVQISSDDGGRTWTDIEGTFGSFTEFAWHDGLFLGSGGGTNTSNDGLEWTSVNNLGVGELVVLDGKFFGHLGSGAIMSTTDGTSYETFLWENGNPRFQAVAWDPVGDVWVGAGFGGALRSSVDDGQSWTPRSSGLVTNWSGAIWTGEVFLVWTAGDALLISSPDGVSWTDVSHQNRTTAMAVGDGRIVAATGSSRLLISEDHGQSWAEVPVAGRTEDVIWTGSRFVAAGDNGRVFISSRGVSWTTTRTLPEVVQRLHDVETNGTNFAAVGRQAAMRSQDGLTWNAASLDNPPSFLVLLRVASDGDGYVAVGSSFSGGEIWRSDDGLAWQQASFDNGANLNDVIWTGTEFVAVGQDGRITASGTGEIWTERDSSTTLDLIAITGDTNQMVALGRDGLIATSQDGVLWQSTPGGLPTPGFDALDLTFDGQTYLVVGPFGYRATSPDSVQWTVHPEVGEEFPTYWGADVIDGQLAAIGQPGALHRSFDGGTTWTSISAPTSGTLRGTAQLGDLVVAVGYDAMIFHRIGPQCVIFSDGFESGDLSAWTLSVP
ncbi:MAG: hypothetical protein K0U98_18875 [Deltaproteobacteria bacterium]|nr:hypothetical protein [Deltaproteobacteria bacterium]